MKNLKLFVFSLCLMLVAVLSVNAAECNLPGQSLPGVTGSCQASLNGTGYALISDAWNEFLAEGGDLVAYTDVSFGTGRGNIVKSGTIEFKDGHSLTFTGVLDVSKNATLTVKNTKLNLNTATSSASVAQGSTLVLDNSTTYVGLSAGSIVNKGTINVVNGELRGLLTGTPIVKNEGTLSLNGVYVPTNTTVVENQGTATLTNVEVEAHGSNVDLVDVKAHNSSATINGGTYKVLRHVVTTSAPTLAHGQKAATVTVKGEGTYETNGDAFLVDNGVVLNIENGTVDATGNVVNMKNAIVSVANGTLTSTYSTVATYGNAANASLKVSGGKLVSENKYPLHFENDKATYAISGGTFESEVEDYQAIEIINLGVKTDNKDVTTIAKAYTGILTGGKYLNYIIYGVEEDGKGATRIVTNLLVAEGYEVKEVTEGNKTYKVVVKTGATDVEPEKQPDATKPGSTGSEELPPDTYDAGLTYMGLAVLAVGASVVSVRKLRNN